MTPRLRRSHLLRRTQHLQAGIDEVFSFFEDPRNLGEITPPWLRFRILRSTDPSVCLGTEIVYRLRWQVFPIRWRTRITEYEPPRRFADEMVSGPYRSWYHVHRFEVVDQGVRMTDEVRYELPFGLLGHATHKLVIQRQLNEIFDYRYRAIEQIFGHESRHAAT